MIHAPINWFSAHPNSGPVAPRPGPARRAVLVYLGTWRIFPCVVDAIAYARDHEMIGATNRCVGDRGPCAEILPFDWDSIFNFRTATGSVEHPDRERAERMIA